MKKRYYQSLIFGIVILFCLGGIAGLSYGQDSVKIAVVTPKPDSGPWFGFIIIEDFVKKLNQGGGILGKQISLIGIAIDTPLRAKLAAKKAVDAGVVAVIGPEWSSLALAMAPTLQQAKIPMIATWATHPNVTVNRDYIFRVCFTDPFQGTVLANFAIQDLKAKSGDILTSEGNKYSIGLSQFIKQSFASQGGTIVYEGDYLDTSTDFTPQLQQLKSRNPDVLFIPGYARDAGFIMKQARKMGIQSAFLGGDGWNGVSTTLKRIFDYGGAAINGSYYTMHYSQNDPREEMQMFRKLYPDSDWDFPMEYDAIWLLTDAIKRANSFNPQKIRDALASTKNFKGVTGIITMGPNGDPIKSVAILKNENQESVFVKNVFP